MINPSIYLAIINFVFFMLAFRVIICHADDVWVEPITGMQFIKVTGGCYEMGCYDDSLKCRLNEKPAHKVCVDDFWLGKYEVTQHQWATIMEQNPSHYQSGDNYPVEGTSWEEVQTFIRKFNETSMKKFRLPTEAEWEYAARSGGKNEIYSGSANAKDVAWFWRNSSQKTHPVGELKPNGLGFHDMSGNVWEWCSDWYSRKYYANSPVDNPQGPTSGRIHVYRGGDWFHNEEGQRTITRGKGSPHAHDDFTGCRLVWLQ